MACKHNLQFTHVEEQQLSSCWGSSDDPPQTCHFNLEMSIQNPNFRQSITAHNCRPPSTEPNDPELEDAPDMHACRHAKVLQHWWFRSVAQPKFKSNLKKYKQNIQVLMQREKARPFPTTLSYWRPYRPRLQACRLNISEVPKIQFKYDKTEGRVTENNWTRSYNRRGKVIKEKEHKRQ